MAFKVFGDLLNVHDLFHIVKFLEDRPFKFPYDCRQIECSCFCNVLVCLFSQVDHYPYISCNNLIWTWLLNLYSYLFTAFLQCGLVNLSDWCRTEWFLFKFRVHFIQWLAKFSFNHFLDFLKWGDRSVVPKLCKFLCNIISDKVRSCT